MINLLNTFWRKWLSNSRSWWPTITLFPSLYFFSWFVAQVLCFLFGISSDNFTGFIVTTCSFIFFLLLLPSWVRYRWKKSFPWQAIGLTLEKKDKSIIFFLQGFLWALCLVLLLITVLFWGGWIETIEFINLKTLMNALFLVVVIGFAEELIFRGWLLVEMINLLGPRLGIIAQAAIFSVLHLRVNTSWSASIALFCGLFLLGIVLSFRRILHKGSLWGCIGFHGGLVGIWFFIDSGLLHFSTSTPSFFIGFDGQSINPISGMISIFTLSTILYFQRSTVLRIPRLLAGTDRASSSDEMP